MNKDFEELKELPFIKKLQDDFKDQNLSDEALLGAFKGALVLQEVGIGNKIMHFLADVIRWIWSSYKSQIELNEEKRDAHDTFENFLEATKLKITDELQR